MVPKQECKEIGSYYLKLCVECTSENCKNMVIDDNLFLENSNLYNILLKFLILSMTLYIIFVFYKFLNVNSNYIVNKYIN